MISVHKIAHATYETPDLDQQAEYYTDIMGLTLVSKDKDTAYLASTVDHHSIVLRPRQLPQRKSFGALFELTACHDRHLAATFEIFGATAAECCNFWLSISCARCSRERMVPIAHPAACAASA